MKRKSVMNPKTALMTSVLSMLLCVAMFVGTTYAWFSSGFTNTQNNIMAGTLDVALEYYDTSMISSGSTNGNWVEVDENTKIFDPDAKYEPGYTEVVYLRVVNKGSLALKYQLGVSVNEEQLGINKDGEMFKLSDYVMFGVAETDVGANTYEFSAYNQTDADRKAARDSVADTAEIIGLGYRSKPAVLNAEDNKVDYLTMVVYMPETVGNEANAQPGKEASINLAIDLFAAQTEYEDDSFGIGYDKDAVLNTVLPAAKVNKSSVSKVNATLGMGGTAEPFDLDAAFKFATTDTTAEAQDSAYRYWHADFVVSANKKVAANSVALAGYYAAYCDDYNNGNWVALVSDQDIPAKQEIRLLELLLQGGSMSYQELCQWVPTFECGVADLSDGGNDGTTLTVELRLYEVLENTPNVSEETGEYVTIGTYTYTFGNTKLPVADVTEVTPEDVTATAGMGGALMSEPLDLDCQFVFKTTETKESAAEGSYAYWHADFVVSADKDVADGSIALAGYYAAYCDGYNNGNWVALINQGMPVAAGEEIRLLEAMLNGGSMNYQELCQWVPEFECGAADLGGSNAGTTLTVELRLYEVIENDASTAAETGNYITLGTYTHTFA